MFVDPGTWNENNFVWKCMSHICRKRSEHVTDGMRNQKVSKEASSIINKEVHHDGRVGKMKWAHKLM